MKRIRSKPSRTSRLAAQAKPPDHGNGRSADPGDARLSTDEKRRRLAQIVRFNFMDCLDASGTFDVDRARSLLPPSAANHIIVRETTRIDRQGTTIHQRDIRMRLTDGVRAMHLDDVLLRQQEKQHTEDSAAAEANAQLMERRADAEERGRQFLEEQENDEHWHRFEAEIHIIKANKLREKKQQSSEATHAPSSSTAPITSPHHPKDSVGAPRLPVAPATAIPATPAEPPPRPPPPVVPRNFTLEGLEKLIY